MLKNPLLAWLDSDVGHSFKSSPVAMTAAGIDATMAGRLKELRIRRLLLKPFKIRDLVATVETLLVAATVPG